VTLPTAFATAIHGLWEKANLQSGETVLIHSAAGGVGIAAIQVARLRGAQIFATVGTQEKKDFLVNKFGLKPDHIFSSRDASFVPGILAATHNRGVDVVLNSLTKELLHESWRLCAPFGRFVEIGKADLVAAGRLDIQVFLRSASFIAIDLFDLYHHKNPASRERHPA
jgi:NADPH:quinone reductase-like Zn-dependent oxidoreductase